MKKKSPNFPFYFFFIGLLYPPHWEHCHSEKLSRKKLSLKNFLSEKYNFYHLPCVAPLINFAKSFNILFSWKYFSMTKKITWKDFFNFHHQSYLPYLPPLIKISFKKVVWLEKDIFFERHSVSKLYILFLKSFLCTPLMNHTKTINTFLMRTKINDKKFLQKMIFLFYHRPSVTSLITMSLEKIYMKKIFMKIIFS